MALNRAELTRLKDMIESRVSQLLLFKLYVECDGCGGEDGPLVLAAHEGTHELLHLALPVPVPVPVPVLALALVVLLVLLLVPCSCLGTASACASSARARAGSETAVAASPD